MIFNDWPGPDNLCSTLADGILTEISWMMKEKRKLCDFPWGKKKARWRCWHSDLYSPLWHRTKIILWTRVKYSPRAWLLDDQTSATRHRVNHIVLHCYGTASRDHSSIVLLVWELKMTYRFHIYMWCDGGGARVACCSRKGSDSFLMRLSGVKLF